jgi:hypothetical protein
VSGAKPSQTIRPAQSAGTQPGRAGSAIAEAEKSPARARHPIPRSPASHCNAAWIFAGSLTATIQENKFDIAPHYCRFAFSRILRIDIYRYKHKQTTSRLLLFHY